MVNFSTYARSVIIYASALKMISLEMIWRLIEIWLYQVVTSY